MTRLEVAKEMIRRLIYEDDQLDGDGAATQLAELSEFCLGLAKAASPPEDDDYADEPDDLPPEEDLPW